MGRTHVQSRDPSLETAARLLKIALITAPVHGDVEIEAAIVALGREPGGGLVLMPDVFTNVHRAPIILAAARNKLPAVYWLPEIAREGGLLSYGVDQVDGWRGAATYVDRILRGEKPGDLPCSFRQNSRWSEPQDRHGAWPCGTPIDPAARRRGHRINVRYVGLWH